MIRSRSTTPRNHASRKHTPLRRRESESERPAWNDTSVGDTDKYKLTPEQMARKKQLRVSKNMVSLSASKHSNTSEWGSEVKQPRHGSPDARSGAHSPDYNSNNRRGTSGTPEGSQGQRRSETPSSPPINYAAVLQMLNRHREEGLHSPNRFSLGAEAAGLPAAAAAPATAAAGGPIPDPRNRHSGSNPPGMQAEFDATLGGFSRLDIPPSTAPPPNHPLTPGSTSTAAGGAAGASAPAPAFCSSYNPSAASPYSAPAFSSSYNPSTAYPNLGEGRAQQQQQGGVPDRVDYPDALNHGLPYSQPEAPPPLSLGAAMDSMWDQQHGMSSRLSSVEAALANQQGSGVRAEELEDVRALVRQLSADQARMRADLQSFSNHATQLMSALQAQVQQLARQAGGQPHTQPTQPSTHHPTHQTHIPQQSYNYPPQQLPHPQYQPSQYPQQSPHNQQQDSQKQQTQHLLSVQGLVPHLGGGSGGGERPTSSEHPPPPPRRSLFTDLPSSSPTMPHPLSSHHQQQQQSPLISRPAPPHHSSQGDIDDAQLSLPSYAAMRRSAAGISTSSPLNPAHPAPFPRPYISTTSPHPYPTPATEHRASHAGGSQAAEVAASLASIHAPTHPPAMGLGPRIMPTSFQPRALGAPPPASDSAEHGSFLGQGAAGTAVAAAGGNLASFGIDLPAHRMGGPDLRGASAESRSNAECSDNGHSGSGRPSEGIRGRPSSFGTHHPEPLLFDVASDFKIVRVGNASTGKGGAPENSLSYAAHTAAAARQKEARGLSGKRP